MNSIIDQQKQDAEFKGFNPKTKKVTNFLGKGPCDFHKENEYQNSWESAMIKIDPKRLLLWPETPISTQIQR